MSLEPKIYTKNYVTSECTFTCSHGDDFVSRMCDGDRDSQYISSGANNDATSITVVIEFIEALQAQSRTIDRMLLINHNLKNFTIDQWDGAAWVNVVSETVCATTSTIWLPGTITTTKLRITATSTQTVNAEKAWGEFIACALQVAFTQEMVQYRVTSRQEAVELKLADGTLRRTVMKNSPNRSNKYEANAQFRFLTTTELESLREIKESGAAFLWQPESVSRVDEIYYVHWVGGFQYQYVTTYKGAGHQIDMQLKEA